MKKIILLFAIMGATLAANCQKIQTDSKGNYFAVKTNQDSSKATNTGKTFTDQKGNTYPVFVSAKGKLFVKRVSKTGTNYNQYLKLN